MNLYYSCIKHTKIFRKGSDWIIDSVIEHDINISKFNSLTGRSYIKLQK